MVEHLIIFCKAPRPGFVKTRLAASVGSETACRHYRYLADTVFRQLQAMEHVELRFTPDDAAGEVAAWKKRPSWRTTPQGPGSLGDRLNAAFDDCFQMGAERVVVIGTDTPELSESDVREAFLALRQEDVVVGPSEDGGYWLIGLTDPHPELFDNQDWGTDRVCQETLVRAQVRGLQTRLLRLLPDIDTEEDWNRFRQRQVAWRTP
ncbi:MAG: TIGR04282 family arsenosugar biosynthesis glycosyltransferase [Verrucomicrobiales bacterium]|nr:TIGR04282 family arsenosugar biosynthesis glycosyltransferase [Verrucomicrobiales bacterium]